MKTLILVILLVVTGNASVLAAGSCYGTAHPTLTDYQISIEPRTEEGELVRNENGRVFYEMKMTYMNETIYSSNTVVFDRHKIAFTNGDSLNLQYQAEYQWYFNINLKKLGATSYNHRLNNTPFHCTRMLLQLVSEDKPDEYEQIR